MKEITLSEFKQLKKRGPYSPQNLTPGSCTIFMIIEKHITQFILVNMLNLLRILIKIL